MSTKYSLNKTKFLSATELNILTLELIKNRDKDFRNVTMIELALKTGARATEILNITAQDLNHDDRSVFIRGIKKSNDREIPLPKPLFEQLVTLSKDSDRLFPISYERLKQIWNEYRPCKKGFHSLRHTVGLNVYDKHRDIKLVQTVLGHRSITNSQIYCDYRYSTQELRRLLK